MTTLLAVFYQLALNVVYLREDLHPFCLHPGRELPLMTLKSQHVLVSIAQDEKLT